MDMEVPRGCNIEGRRDEYVLKLQKNLYGSKQAGRVWYKYLRGGLRKRGFKQSKLDECIFYKDGILFIVYVDDAIIIGPNKRKIDEIIESLKKDYKLKDEGDLNEYLGIKMQRLEDGSRKLTQPALIKRILKQVQIPEQRPKKRQLQRTPANKVLQKDLGGLPRQHNWDYRSVIGMLNWLAKSTRPDIAFAVSQVARFQVNPRRSHENAVLRICKYLRDTKEEGMTMRAKNEGFVVYADSDFAGGYMKGHTHDPDTAKPRSAYYIMFNGCLVFWSSKLQTEIALRTTEAEYICLSQA